MLHVQRKQAALRAGPTSKNDKHRDLAMKALVTAFAIIFAFASPTLAITAKEKMDTCKFGAADQQLTGKKQQDFIKKCMANEPAAKTTAAKPAAKAPAPAK
jgi:hypothetical protein